MRTSLRIPEDIGKRLTVLSEVTGRTKTFYILEALVEHIDTMEEVYLSEAALERVRQGQERVYTSEEMAELIEKMDN